MRGKTVAILESRFGEQLADLVSKRGGHPLRAPALAEVPDVDTPFVANLVAELKSDPAKIAIFQTRVRTHALFRATDSLGLTGNFLALLAQMVVVARGPKPTAARRSRGVRIDLSAQRNHRHGDSPELEHDVVPNPTCCSSRYDGYCSFRYCCCSATS